MTPTVHYDMKKAEEAAVAYDTVAHFCVTIISSGVRAKTEFGEEIKQTKKQLAEGGFPDYLVDQVKGNVVEWAAIGSLTDELGVAAKEAQAVMAKLEKAFNELRKKPADKKLMDAFALCVKNASLNCGKLRTCMQKFTADKIRMMGAGTKMAYVNNLKMQAGYLQNCVPKLAPPRPLSGPPIKK